MLYEVITNSQNLSNAEDYYGEYYNGEEYFQPAPHEHREYYVERRGHHSIMREPYEVQVAHSMRDHDSQDYFVAPAGYAPPRITSYNVCYTKLLRLPLYNAAGEASK